MNLKYVYKVTLFEEDSDVSWTENVVLNEGDDFTEENKNILLKRFGEGVYIDEIVMMDCFYDFTV